MPFKLSGQALPSGLNHCVPFHWPKDEKRNLSNHHARHVKLQLEDTDRMVMPNRHSP